jgi:hypothetical protein
MVATATIRTLFIIFCNFGFQKTHVSHLMVDLPPNEFDFVHILRFDLGLLVDREVLQLGFVAAKSVEPQELLLSFHLYFVIFESSRV